MCPPSTINPYLPTHNQINFSSLCLLLTFKGFINIFHYSETFEFDEFEYRGLFENIECGLWDLRLTLFIYLFVRRLIFHCFCMFAIDIKIRKLSTLICCAISNSNEIKDPFQRQQNIIISNHTLLLRQKMSGTESEYNVWQLIYTYIYICK